jgi:hypothetical protein
LLYRRDAFISLLNGSEAGRGYLADAARLEKTDIDRESLRKHF